MVTHQRELYLIIFFVGLTFSIIIMLSMTDSAKDHTSFDSDKLSIPDYCRIFNANWDESQLKCSGGGFDKKNCEYKGGTWINSTDNRVCIFENYSP